jgi:hypothetical protein
MPRSLHHADTESRGLRLVLSGETATTQPATLGGNPVYIGLGTLIIIIILLIILL